MKKINLLICNKKIIIFKRLENQIKRISREKRSSKKNHKKSKILFFKKV